MARIYAAVAAPCARIDVVKLAAVAAAVGASWAVVWGLGRVLIAVI